LILTDLLLDAAESGLESAATRGGKRSGSTKRRKNTNLPNLAAANLRLADRQRGLQDRIDKLTARNLTLTRKLRKIATLTETNNDLENVLDDIQRIAESINGNGQ